jgi:hypothetical protein
MRGWHVKPNEFTTRNADTLRSSRRNDLTTVVINYGNHELHITTP